MRNESPPLNPALAASRAPDLLGALKRQALAILVCVIVGAGLGFAYTKATKISYQSKATVQLLPLPGEKAPGGGRERTLDVETQATVARSTTLLQTIGARLGLTAVEVQDKSSVEAAPTGDVMYILFDDDVDTKAAAGALVYTEEFLAQRKGSADDIAKRQQQLLQDQIDALQTDIADLTAEIAASADEESAQTLVLKQRQSIAISDAAALRDERDRIDTDLNPGRVVVDPRTAVNQTGLDKKFAIAGGMFVGLLVGILAALLRDRRDDRYGSALGLDSLGMREIGTVRQPGPQRTGRADPVRRSYARLVVRLSLSNGVGGGGHRSVLLAAVESTTMSANTAHAVATALLDEAPENGLDARILQSEAGPTVSEGESTPSWDHFASVLGATQAQSDVVFVTALSLDRSASALAIAPRVDQIVLLVSPATRLQDLNLALEDIHSVDAREVSVLVVRRGHGLLR